MAGPSRLDWDAANLDKCQKHGVSIEEIDAVFAGDPFTTPDEAHSQDEDRFIAIGATSAGRLIFIVFTVRVSGDEEIVRPLSARFMHRKEVDRYARLWGQEGPKIHH